MWRPVVWTHAPASRDVTCVGRVVGGGRRVVRFERCDVHAYVSGVSLADAARAAHAAGATVERADVACIYAERAERAPVDGAEQRPMMLRVVAPSSAALGVALAAAREAAAREAAAREADTAAAAAPGPACGAPLAPLATYEAGVTSLTRLLQRRGHAPHGLLSLESDAPIDEPLEAPCGLVVAVRAPRAVLLDGETHDVADAELAPWLEAREVDVVVSFDSDVRAPSCCVSIKLRAVLADGTVSAKCSTLAELARSTLGGDVDAVAPTGVADELALLARVTTELGVVEHLVELANVTGVQLRDLVRRGVVHRSLEQVLRAANAAGYVLPDDGAGDGAGRRALVGGLVLAPVVGVHRDAVAALDFASMYPSLIMAHGLCYTATGAVLPPLMRAMHARRAALQGAARAARADETRALAARRLDARQRAVKLAMNCIFGMAACADGPLPCARLAAQITAAGRDALRLAASELAHAATVVYGDSVTADTRVVVYERGAQGEQGAERGAQGEERGAQGEEHDDEQGAEQGAEHGEERTVEELFDAYEREPAAPPLLTRTLVGLAPIRAVVRRASAKRVFRVTLASGASVDVTEDHSLVAHDGALVSPRELVVGQTRLATRGAWAGQRPLGSPGACESGQCRRPRDPMRHGGPPLSAKWT